MSNYAKHIVEQSHSFGPIHNTMQILQYHDKGTHLNTTHIEISSSTRRHANCIEQS